MRKKTNRIPVTILTGFLGSGKTTVLRNLLIRGHQRLAVMVNEFGSVGLDGDLIRSCGFCPDDEIEGRLVELNNGCLCCTVQDEFLPTMEKLLSRSDDLDGIIIETSGLALPRPLIQALDWPSIRTKVHVNGLITLVDGMALSLGSPVGDMNSLEKQIKEDESLDHFTPVEDLFSNQLKSADLVLISRADQISHDQITQIKTMLLDKVRKGTRIVPISNGNIDSSFIVGLQHNEINKPLSETSHNSNNLTHDDHSHVEITTANIRLEVNLRREQLEPLLQELANNYEIVRLKGRCWLPGKQLPLQIQMVGPRINTWFEKVPSNAWIPESTGVELVVMSLIDKNQIDLDKIIKSTLISRASNF